MRHALTTPRQTVRGFLSLTLLLSASTTAVGGQAWRPSDPDPAAAAMQRESSLRLPGGGHRLFHGTADLDGVLSTGDVETPGCDRYGLVYDTPLTVDNRSHTLFFFVNTFAGTSEATSLPGRAHLLAPAGESGPGDRGRIRTA